MKADVVVSAKGLTKSYREGSGLLQVLTDVSLDVMAGERIAIVGKSGSGKSTLLHLLGGLDKADGGSVSVCQQDLSELDERQRGRVRNQHLGFIYQFHHLLADFNAVENVAMPLMIRGDSRSSSMEKASRLLGEVGLADRLDHRPGELSGGERQRVAISRALVTEPDCVLADEPTGNLDETTAQEVNELMIRLSDNLDIAFVIVTHNRELADTMDRQYRLEQGCLKTGLG